MPKERLEDLAFASYWDNRYTLAKAAGDGEGRNQTEDIPETEDMKVIYLESFEWFKNFEKLRPFFEKHMLHTATQRKDCYILHLGCGNSTLTSDFAMLGYTNQISVDFSSVVISAMSEKYAALNTIWLVMDVRALTIEKESVDFAIDKGTLDAFLHGSLWDPPEDVRESVGSYVNEVARVLRKKGKWLYITYRQPHFLRPLLERRGIWDLSVEVLEDSEGGGGFEYFGFVMTKM